MERLASAMNFSRIMEERGERIGQEGSAEDRLSDLPKNVIEHIIELLPAPDAARTCVLSRNWRYVWAYHPSIVLDEQFWFELMKNKSESSFQIEFINTVNKIILQHITSIQKFVLDISILSPTQFPNVDPWLLHIAYKGLREFTLKNSPRSPYKIPSCLFDCSELTLLSLFNCIIKPPKALVVFNKLKRLFLQHITFHSAVTISTPLLVSLSLQSCQGTNILNISAPLLVSLLLAGNEDLNLSCFMACKNIKRVLLALCAVDEHQRSVAESINLTELCAAWPMLREFILHEFYIRHVIAVCSHERLSPQFNHLKTVLLFHIDYEIDLMTWILNLLWSSPVLNELLIWNAPNINDYKIVQDFLEKKCHMMQRMKQLRTVKFKDFVGSRSELLLIKLLLVCCTSLKRVVIDWNRRLDLSDSEQLRISKVLMGFRRSSPKAVIVFQQIEVIETKVYTTLKHSRG